MTKGRDATEKYEIVAPENRDDKSCGKGQEESPRFVHVIIV